MYELIDWQLDMPNVASAPCQKSGNNLQLNFRCKERNASLLSWQYNLKSSNFQFSLSHILIDTERFNKTLGWNSQCFLTVLTISLQLIKIFIRQNNFVIQVMVEYFWVESGDKQIWGMAAGTDGIGGKKWTHVENLLLGKTAP